MDQEGVEVIDPGEIRGFCLIRAANLKPRADQPPSLGPLARDVPEGLRHVGDQVRKEMCLTPVIGSTNFMCVEAIPPRQNAEWQQQI